MVQYKVPEVSVLPRKGNKSTQSTPVVYQNASHRFTVALSDSAVIAVPIKPIGLVERIPCPKGSCKRLSQRSLAFSNGAGALLLGMSDAAN